MHCEIPNLNVYDSRSDDQFLVESLYSSVTSYTNHLNPIQLTLSVNSSYYYPGQLLTFYYDILDKFGNKISVNNTSRLRINIETNSFFSTALQIEQDGSCPFCDGKICFRKELVDCVYNCFK